MTQKSLLSRKEARESLSYRGKSIKQWAKENGFPYGAVCDVLNRDRPWRIGLGHKIAVKLGMKNGVIEE